MRISAWLLAVPLSVGLWMAAPLSLPAQAGQAAQQTEGADQTQLAAEKKDADHLFEIGRTEEAKAIYMRIASSFANDFEFNKRLAYCFFVSPQKEMAEAARYYARAYALNPQDPEVEMNLGKAYSWSKQYPAAIEVLQRIVARSSAPGDAWLELARAQNFGGQPEAARATYESYLRRSPGDRGVRLEFAAFLTWYKQYDAGLEQYQQLLKADPNDLRARVGEGQVLAWQGKVPESLQDYDAVLRREPEQYDALRGRAFDLLWLGRYDEAAQTFAEVTKQRPPDQEVQNALQQLARLKAEAPERQAQAEIAALRDQAQAAVGQNDFARAVSLLNQAIARAPQDTSLVFQLGQVYAWSRQWDAAIATFQKLYAAQPNKLEALRELGNAQVGANKLGEAAASYRAYLEQKPDDQGVRLNLARALSWSGKFDEASATYQQILQSEPNNLDAMLGLAYVYAWEGQSEQALKLFDQLLRIQPDNHDALLGKAKILYWSGNTKESLDLLRNMQQHWPQDLEVNRTLESVREAERQRALQQATAARPANLEESIRTYQAALAQSPSDVRTLEALGSLYNQKGDYTEATSYYQKALALQPGDKNLQLTLARVASWNRDFPRSVSLYQALLAQDPANRDYRLELARVLSWAGRNAESVQQYREMLKRDPQDTEARLGLARVLSWDRQYDAALEEYGRILQADPQNHDAKLESARIHCWKGDLSGALSLYDELLARNPADVEASLGRAQALFWSGRPREAKGILEGLQQKDPKNRDVALALASVNSSLGLRTLALQQLDELDKLQPGNPDVASMRQSIQESLRPQLILGFTPSVDSYDLAIYYATAAFSFSPTPQIRTYLQSNIIPSINSPASTSATGREFLAGSYGRVTDWLLLRGEAGLNSDVFGRNGGIWGLGGTLFASDNMQFDVNVSRRFINYIPRPVVLNINRIQYRGAWDWHPYRWAGVHLDYYHENYSDSNRNNGGNFSLTGKPVHGERTDVEVGYLYAVSGFTRIINSGFFAPFQFQRHAALLNLREKVTPRNSLFFWGSLGREQVFYQHFRWDGTARAGWEYKVSNHTKFTLGYGYFAITSILRAGAYRTNTGYATFEYLF